MTPALHQYLASDDPIPVLWWDGQRGYWDHGMIRAWLANDLYSTPVGYAFEEHLAAEPVGDRGCVLVLSARGLVGRESEIRAFIERRAWTLVLCLSDEEGVFDPAQLLTPTSIVYVQTPHARRVEGRPGLRRLILGWPGRLREVGACLRTAPEKRLLWSFAGQVTHAKRQECVAALRSSGDDSTLSETYGFSLVETHGFGQGLPYEDYVSRLAASWLAPSPSGPETPDCFRTWEALELGCMPIADRSSPTREWPGGDYYRYALEDEPPFATIVTWRAFPGIAREYSEDPEALPRDAARVFAWWQRYKRRIVAGLDGDLFAVSGIHPAGRRDTLGSMVTVLIPTSPVPSHPSTAMIEECVTRIRAYPDLADAEIIISIDAVRAEQPDRSEAYAEYVRRLLWLCNWDPRFRGVLPLVQESHAHQATMARQALEYVRTPLVLYVEHDTWPVGDIDWRGLAGVVERGACGVGMVRLHYDVGIHPEHRYLMLDAEPIAVAGVPLVRTMQWSQRPHLARADYYRRIIGDNFRPGDRTMIEDVMHGVVQSGPWENHGLAIYAPPGGMKRSDTCDGRGADPKFPMVFRSVP